MTDKNIEIPESFYFHGDEVNHFLYVQVPISLIKENVFKGVSDSAKLLYGLLLNRTGLSVKNGWVDEDGRIYVSYTVETLMKEFEIGSTKAKGLFAELSDINGTGIGLIKKVRVLNKPSRIYVMNFTKVFEYLMSLEQECPAEGRIRDRRWDGYTTDGGTDIEPAEGRICDLRRDAHATDGETDMRPMVGRIHDLGTDAVATEKKKDNNNHDMSDHYPIISIREKAPYDEIGQDEKIALARDIIRENIDYEELVRSHDWDYRERLDELVEIMVEACVCDSDIIIGGKKVTHGFVESTFMNYNPELIEYVMESIATCIRDVRNPKKYLLSALYNAPMTISNHTRIQSNHDMYEGA